MLATHRNRTFRSISVLACSLALAACGGGSGGGTVAPPPPSPPPPPPPPPMASFGPNFSEIQASVFTPTCATAGCHSGAGAPLGLDLGEASSFGLLVGVASGQMPAIMRVAPGDPDNSYLIQKLEGSAGAGSQMPLNQNPLPQVDIDVIRQWIVEGAIDDRAQATAPIRVTSLSPLPGAALATAPSSVTAIFDRDPDPSTVNANTFILEGSGGDGTFSDGNEVAVTAAAITVPAGNTMTAIFDLTGFTLPDDAYRVQILGDGPSLVLDMDANALDGEFDGGFPSGDGTAGGDFSATFDVMAPVQMGPTLDEIQAAVFTPSCSSAGCHSGPAGNALPGGMDLTNSAASFAALVGVASIQQPGILRVAAGDADNSYLIQKLEGTAASGGQMPLGGAPLAQSVIDDVRQWIDDGAMQ